MRVAAVQAESLSGDVEANVAAAAKWTVAAAAALLCVAILAMRLLGLEFLPKLEEGNLWIRATLPSTISLEEGNKYVNQMRAAISGFPEVESVVSQHGRPDDLPGQRRRRLGR